MRMVLLCLALMLAVLLPSRAQVARETEFMGQPLIYAKDGKLHGCGVRVFATEAPAKADAPIFAVDASIQLDLRFGGMLVKFTAFRTKFRNGKFESRIQEQVERGWFRVDGTSPTKPKDGNVVPTVEPVGGVMYRTEQLEDLQMLTAIFAGKTLELGLKLKGDTGDTVRFGPVQLSEGEKGRFESCMTDLMAEVKK